MTSIGRLYNINGRDLAKYNNIDYEKGLSLGQVLKIPATTATSNVIQAPVVKAEVVAVKPEVKDSKAGTPIYHVVEKKETLYHISTLYNKVPIADIKKWNNLTTDGVAEGTRLIVGYTNSASVKQSDVKEVVVVKEKPVTVKSVEPIKPPVVVVKEKEVEKKVEQVKEQPVVNYSGGKSSNGGYFKSLYIAQTKNADITSETGTAGIFKSTSGWEDGKYYCLHNTASSGTIVKITNNISGKVVYAKVLDVIPDIKQNNGLVLRLSNAAAEELGVSDAKFDCTVAY